MFQIDNLIDTNDNHQNHEKFSPLWFGPRMGKKKITEKLIDRSKLFDLLESLNEYPWTIIAINNNRGM